MSASKAKRGTTPSNLIDTQIAELADWRGDLLARPRRLILKTVPDITGEWKWGTAVWSKHGMVCAAGAFKDHVKLNFFKGASLRDPKGVFNGGLSAKTSRAIDFGPSSKVDEPASRALVREAVDYNTSGGKKRPAGSRAQRKPRAG